MQGRGRDRYSQACLARTEVGSHHFKTSVSKGGRKEEAGKGLVPPGF